MAVYTFAAVLDAGELKVGREKLLAVELTESEASLAREKMLWRLVLVLTLVGVCALGLSALLVSWDRTVSSAIRARNLPGDVRKAIELSEAFAHGSGVVAILLTLFLAAKRPRTGILTV